MSTSDSLARPQIFLSSTIRDMRDLRDALKFWLEEMGYDVQLSEHNDFERRPDDGTFDACFQSIRKSDYYLLLIGERKGQTFESEGDVSVTQQEYRVAYSSWSSRQRPKILPFVRHDVMVALRERSKAGISADEKSTLDDPAFTSRFVEEVRRTRETNDAVRQAGGFPGANWLVDFSGFRDLTDALRAALSIKGPLAKAAVLESLRHELRRNLGLTMMKIDGRLMHRHGTLSQVREEVVISRENLQGEVRLSFQNLKHLMLYHATPADVLLTDALENAVFSGVLLQFDAHRDSLAPSSMLQALYSLREELAVYRKRFASFWDDYRTIGAEWFEVKEDKRSGTLPTMLLISHFALNDSEQNVVRITTGILRHMYGHTTDIDFQIRPLSPIPDEDEKMRWEKVTEEDIEAALLKDSLLLTLGSVEMTDEQRADLDEAQTKLESILGPDLMRAYRERFRERFSDEMPETREDIQKLTSEVLAELGIGKKPEEPQAS